MKRIYTIAIICSLIAYNLSAGSIDNRYDKLKDTPGYEGMSVLAIAATLDDFDAIDHFLITASAEELTTTQAILENRLDIFKKELRQKIPRETIDPISKNESARHAKIHHKIYGIKNSLKKISSKLSHESD